VPQCVPGGVEKRNRRPLQLRFPGFPVRGMVGSGNFMRLSVKSFTSVADPREMKRDLFGDLFVPMTMGAPSVLGGEKSKK
jgi:hypothetical protein